MPPPSAGHFRRRSSRLPEERKPPVIGVAGVGLIGGSIALRARVLEWEVVGWDPDLAAVADARAGGALSSSVTSFGALAAEVDLLVLAGPLDSIVAQLGLLRSSPALRPGTLVLDVGSVKAPVARAGEGLPAFVPTHPIAGSEKSGAGSARADLFHGRTWAYDGGLHPAAAARAVPFILAMGARAFEIDSLEHDRLIALTSHVPQMLSIALGERLQAVLGEPATLALCGPGIRSMLRLAASSFSMWGPLLQLNARPVAQEVRALAAILQGAADALECGATDDLRSMFAAAAASVASLTASDAASNVATDNDTNASTDER